MEILKAIWTVYTIVSVVFTTVFLWGLITNIRRELKVVKDVKHAAKTIKIVYIEHADGVYCMYDKITNHFICQALSEQELWNIAREKFPGKDIVTLDADKEAKQV